MAPEPDGPAVRSASRYRPWRRGPRMPGGVQFFFAGIGFFVPAPASRHTGLGEAHGAGQPREGSPPDDRAIERGARHSPRGKAISQRASPPYPPAVQSSPHRREPSPPPPGSMAIWRPHSRLVSRRPFVGGVEGRSWSRGRSSRARRSRGSRSGCFSIRVMSRGRVHAGRQRPRSRSFQSRGVDVVVHHDHPLGVHELAQV